MATRYRLGFDIGGTFTDFVLVDEASGDTKLNKCLTTPDDPSRGVIDGLVPLLKDAGIGGAAVDIAIHATTLITNALIERKGAKTALLTTEGFRDVLEMGTEVRYDIYDLFLENPAPLVPRNRRYEVAERLDKDGKVIMPLDEAGVRRVAGEMRAAGVEAVGICFLHSFRNPAHEQRAAAILAEEMPGVSVSTSSAVAPEIREYERMSTTVANAYAQPITRSYIDTIEQRLTAMQYRRRLYLMISSGGIAGGQTAKDFPIRMLESGPTAGVLAAIYYGRQMGIGSLVTFDMGGTTAKIGLVKNYEASKSNKFEVGRVARFKKGSGLPVKVPMVELIEIGAGGGSIAHVDQLGLLKIGPQSSGAMPGPACYGRGGTRPTVTDANVVLGYLDPGYFLGGAMRLDLGAATRAIDTELGRKLSLSVADCARGIFEIVNQNMLAAMKVHIAERGEDPRKYYLFAFGGAGPAHAYELARALHMRGVLVPPGAGACSATGLVTAAVSFDYARSFVTRLDRVGWPQLREVFEAM
ncbi:MAG: hydantoinase/oxoprolinase family protein, partial [Alphaproteobacteria bacterium]|nr:hydantoinase/oxoprolinase family protein [Alphaproteobacteria bacterium]